MNGHLIGQVITRGSIFATNDFITLGRAIPVGPGEHRAQPGQDVSPYNRDIGPNGRLNVNLPSLGVIPGGYGQGAW